MRASEQAGQTLVIFVVVLALLFVGMIALVADVGSLLVSYNRVDDGALLAIQAGASAIDEGSFYGGSLNLDPTAARQRCEESLAAAQLPGHCTADSQTITVQIDKLVSLPVPLLGLTAPVHVSRVGQPAFGGNQAVNTP